MIDTKTAPRRQVSYQTLDDIVVDAERMAAAGAPTTGNWSKGQIFEHVALIMDMTVNGFTFTLNPFVRFFAKTFFLKRFLKNGMPSGFKPSKPVAQKVVPEETDEQQALNHLRSAIERLKQLDHDVEHAVFGKLDPNQARAINRRHAEMHMSFIAAGHFEDGRGKAEGG